MNFKKRVLYFLFCIFFLWLALATRKYTNFFNSFIIEFGGDIFWATGFMFLLRSILLRINLQKLSIYCYILGVANEFLQLYQAPWIQNIRATYIGGLLLGVGFVPSDLVCYLVGTLLAYIIIIVVDAFLAKKGKHKKATHMDG